MEFHNWVQDKFPPVNGQRAVLAGVNFSSLLLPFPEIKWFGSLAMEIFGGTPPLHQWAYSGVLTETALLGLSREYGLNKHTINDFLTSLYHTQLRTEIDPNTLDTFLRKFCDRPNILDEMLSSFSEEMQDAAQRNHSQHFFAALNFDEFLDVLEGRYEFNELVGRYNLLGEATEITKKDIVAHLAPISNTPYLLRLMFGSRISHMGVDFEILHEGKPLQTLAVQFGKKAAYIVEIQGRKHSPHEMLAFQAKTGLHPTEWLIQAVTLYLFEGRKVEFVRGLGAQRIPDCIKTRKMDHHEQVYYKAYDVAGMKKKKSNDVPNTRMRKRDSWNINDPFPHFQERGGWHPESVYQQMRATFAGIEKTVYAPEATPRFPFKY